MTFGLTPGHSLHHIAFFGSEEFSWELSRNVLQGATDAVSIIVQKQGACKEVTRKVRACLAQESISIDQKASHKVARITSKCFSAASSAHWRSPTCDRRMRGEVIVLTVRLGGLYDDP